MQHPEGSRKERRIRARLEALANAMTPRPPKGLRPGRRQYGVDPTPEQISERAKFIEKFGASADDREKDRRSEDRRKMAMSPDEVENWLKINGIYGGDRRKAQRRQGDRRR
jgi:hypothetical protein